MVGQYGSILCAPSAARLSSAVLLGGLGLGFAPLGFVLFVKTQTGSYAVAGAVLAGFGIGRAIATPAQGRLLDRFGPTLVLAPCALLHVGFMALLLVSGLAYPTALLLVLAGTGAGAAYPALPAVLRVVWPQLVGLDEARLRSAYALDSVVGELLFLAGIVVGGAVAALASPAAALAVMAAATALGTAQFVTCRRLRWPAPAAPAGRSLLGPLSVSRVRVLVGCSLPVGLAYGVFEVCVVAFTDGGNAAMPTILFVIIALGSLAGGLWYGRSAEASDRVLAGGLLLLVPALVVTAAAGSFAWMAFAALLIGLPYAPVAAASSRLLIVGAPAGAQAESFAWVTTMLFLGGAAGSAAAGAIIDGSNVATSALTGAVATLALALGLIVAMRPSGVSDLAAACESPRP
jgi:predicted MFS family arabinose efflux permease